MAHSHTQAIAGNVRSDAKCEHELSHFRLWGGGGGAACQSYSLMLYGACSTMNMLYTHTHGYTELGVHILFAPLREDIAPQVAVQIKVPAATEVGL